MVLTPNQAAEAVAAAVDGNALLEQVNRGRFPVSPKRTRPRGFVAYDLAKYLCGAYEAEATQVVTKAPPPVKKTAQSTKAGSGLSVAAKVKARREALGLTPHFAFRQTQGWQNRQDFRQKLRTQRTLLIAKLTEKYELAEAKEITELNELSVRAFVALKTILQFRQGI